MEEKERYRRMLPNLKTHTERNIDIASFLKASGIAVVSIDTTRPRDVSWVFAEPKRCRELIATYYQRTARVDPQTLLLEAKRLKDDIFNARRKGEPRNENYNRY